MKKGIKIATIEILPRAKDYSSYEEFLQEYPSRKITNNEGVRRCSSKETGYLIREFKKLKIFGKMSDYYYEFITSIELILDRNDGRAISVIIEEPIDIKDYLAGEDVYGTNPDGDEVEVSNTSHSIVDEYIEKTVHFLCREI